MGGFQNYGPVLGTLYIRCRIIMGIQQGIINLTTSHIRDAGAAGQGRTLWLVVWEQACGGVRGEEGHRSHSPNS